jgi:5-methylcytosine-specific restriction endonuclease McrA
LNRIKKKEKKSEYGKRYYMENKERIRENSKRYRSLPHVKLSIKSQKLKRRTLASEGDVTASFLEHLFASQTSCAYCNRPFCPDLKPTVDHVFPVSKGGTHTQDNIVLACQPCNRRKSDKIISVPFSTLTEP